MNTLETVVRRVLLFAAFIVAAIAVFERILNFAGYTFVRGLYSPGRLLEIAAIGLLFVIVLQLRQIRISTSSMRS
ncbi:MAG: hypothetical protein GTO51_08760 [Candidatus Latescibacteria bacterium]|nr:hypothetical protein [Candidatus Latescibacterota bacterium]NIM22043.1 hypothetical protein [Candidatus Latescibacterota bacterium]NIM66061.1 hypothetical protein [Candidatus Latescibacterota bacterium]NIO02469.1 hypothetical protein [Candidatus Latescibacterota bacterium]NIO29380.1 hypothetical protein [Candidatus Latescibacterota bacterium]